GATIALAYLTSLYGLEEVAGVRSGERVLVHAATGGVGMAAVCVARSLGAEVLGTCSDAKRPLLRRMGVEQLASSRDASFTELGPVDVVLNALTGELVDAGLQMLRPGGRFLEMGKRDLRDPEQLHQRFPHLRYLPFDLWDAGPERLAQLLQRLVSRVEDRTYPPLPTRSWPAILAPAALGHMARARHTGKLALRPVGQERTDGAWVITGGLGALGLILARWLIERGVRHLVLLGRRGAQTPGATEALAELSAGGAEVVARAVDVADEAALAEALEALPLPLRGVVHAAGIVDDGLLADQTPERVAAVLAPKVAGAWNLHVLTQDADLDAFLVLSSASGTLGAAGQGPYAAANSFLDALVRSRRARGLPAQGLAFGPWAVGMAGAVGDAVQQGWARAGLEPLSVERGLALLDAGWAHPQPVLVGMGLDPARARASLGSDVPPLWSSLVRAPAQRGDQAPDGDWIQGLRRLPLRPRLVALREGVAAEVGRILGAPVADDAPLAAHGLDSLLAVELRNTLVRRIGARLPATVAFDHPTIERLSTYIADQLGLDSEPIPDGEPGITGPHDLPRASAVSGGGRAEVHEPVAIVGMACRLPGAESPEALWALLCDGRDAIREIGSDRYDQAACYDPEPGTPGRTYARDAGLLDDIASFDAELFRIGAREARALDPAQRLLLEVGHEALERAGIAPRGLAGASVGVYVGIGVGEYGDRFALDDPGAVYAVSGNDPAFAAGRLSWLLGLQGPALAINTMCSSSLVALHLAVTALRRGECELALAGGANAIVGPEHSVLLSQAGALSPTGRCRTFDADADGYVRGEGAGMVVLRRLSDAIADGDPILAVIRGTAVNHDGPSSGLMVPHGPAQATVIRAALADADTAPAEVGYLECHGTGTKLGDPIEVNAAAEAYGPGRTTALRLGSIKTNVGHLEAAAGIAGLLKVVLSLQHRQVPATLHLKTPNPELGLDTLPVTIPTTLEPWPQDAPLGAISSFGLSGTNAHAVLAPAPQPQPQPQPQPRTAPGSARLLVLSGRSPDDLDETARRFEACLRTPGVDWADVAHTAAVGRSAFPHRLALVASDAAGAAAGLARWLRGDGLRGIVSAPPRIKVWFTGRAAPGAARALSRDEPELAAILEAHGLWEPGDASGGARDDLRAQLVMGWFLWRWLQTLGLRPDAVVGTGTGALIASIVDGDLSLEAALEQLGSGVPGEAPSPAVAPRPPEGGLLLVIGAGPVEAGPDTVRLLAGEDPAEALWALGELFVAGVPLSLGAALPGRRTLVPTTPWRRQRYWAELPGASGASRIEVYQLAWSPRPLAPAAVGAGSWAVVPDRGTLAPQLVERLGEGAILCPLEEIPRLAIGRDVVYLGALGHTSPIPVATGRILDEALSLAQALDGQRLWLVTRGGQASRGRIALEQAPLWGFGRVLAHERPELRPALVEIDDTPGSLDALVRLLQSDDPAPQSLLQGELRSVPELIRAPAPPRTDPTLRSDRTYWLIGGLGAMGLHLARWLIEGGARHLVLTGRGGAAPEHEARRAALESLGARVRILPGDVAAPGDVQRILARIDGDGPPLVGVIHAAGVLEDGLIRDQDPARYARVLRPKVAGALAVHRATLGRPLELFLLCSSASGILGTPGQTGYAAANSFLDALARDRRAQGLPAISVAWGPWAGEGMSGAQGAERVRLTGLEPMPPDGALRILGALLEGPPDPVVLQPRPGADLSLSPTVGAAEPGLAARLALEERPAETLFAEISAQVVELLGHVVPRDRGLFDGGLDSLGAMDLRNSLQQRLQLPLPATLVFDHPTIDALCATLLERLGLGAQADPAGASGPGLRPGDEPVAIVGMACRFPGAESPEAFWALLCDGRDAIGPVPPGRWRADARGPLWGGFLDDLAGFDAAAFGVSPAEAEALDPAQRLLLEVSFEALERAGWPIDGVALDTVGVFVGISPGGYGDRLDRGDEDAALYAISGTQPSFAAGRLAHVLGARGPVMAIDTACSSSLVALHAAVIALRRGECDRALVGGANALVTADGSELLAQLGAVSPDGRCKPFDARADGYGRGEGCGVVALRRLSDAEAAGDRVLAVIRGT
ncbi:MAG TPA: SDR family NAD(P)-dependent oxidoreductase, partial [Deltaproteobacteria bacterium]|nr:SDR family NAD(P)-dependent oxidoreductase [Deltaproteobacteria bacterium]